MALTPDIRAWAAGGSATFSGEVAKIVIRYLDYRYPGFSTGITDAIDSVSVGLLAGFAAWITRSAP